ncbi:MAG: AMP-binding protein, partial [Pseudonocardiaceae bacterium]
VDSGGAPVSTTAITNCRQHGNDLREGYGLTETASLTHFDANATRSSLGTVGAAMPEVHTTISKDSGKPIVHLASPAIGTPLDPAAPLPGAVLHTTDLGRIDDHGRLRLLGRADDEQIAGLWPRDTLDALGPLLGRRYALIRHPTTDQATVRLLTTLTPEHAVALRDRAADLLGLPPEQVTIAHQGDRPLLHSAKLSRTAHDRVVR